MAKQSISKGREEGVKASERTGQDRTGQRRDRVLLSPPLFGHAAPAASLMIVIVVEVTVV
jgi:hypothetical protein